MEVLGICYIDGVPLEVCKFLVDNISDADSSEVSNEEQFQRHMVDQWLEIFEQQERRDEDGSTVLYATRDCRVQSSTVGTLWRRCAFVLLPKEPLTVGPAANQQRLLAVTVGKERLSSEEVADRVRATYGSTALLQSQKLQRCGGGASRTDGSDPAEICQGAFFFVLKKDAHVDATVVEEEEVGHSKVCKNEKQDATSALLVSCDPLTGHELKGIPASAALRHKPDAVGVPPPALMATLLPVPTGSAVPNEPRLGEIAQAAIDCKELSSHAENGLPVNTLAKASTARHGNSAPSATQGGVASKHRPGVPRNQTPLKGTSKLSSVGRTHIPMEHVLSMLPSVAKSPVSIAMSSAVGEATAESGTSGAKPRPQPRPQPRPLNPQEECTKGKVEQVVKKCHESVNHEVGEKDSQFREPCDHKVPHCDTTKRQCSVDHSHTVNKPPDLVPKESPDGCSSYQPKRVAQRAPTNVASMATSTELPLLAQDDVIPIALPTDTPTAQSTTPPNVQATDSATPPTAPPTVPPPTLPPAKHPSGEVTLKESIALVTAHQSLKEQPEEYLPPGGMIDKKILKKFFFGYSVMSDVFPFNKLEDSHNQVKGDTLGRGGNGAVYKAGYKDRVFAVKETKYRPDEILKWKKMCHPNLVPLLALQYSFCPVEPLEKGHVVAYCWAYMPVLDTDLRNVLNNMEPLVDRMSTAGPSEVDVMMSNAKHILREILKGLEALHNMGLVHRDIKEHNILLRSQCSCPDYFTCVCPRGNKCEVAIADFDSTVENGARHSSKRIPGTYGYRAPEAYASSKVSQSYDVWGLGIIATKVFLGRDQEEQKKDAATLLNIDAQKQHHSAEVVVPQLKLKDLLCCGVGGLHEAAMFVKECLEVVASRRKSASALLNSPFLSP